MAATWGAHVAIDPVTRRIVRGSVVVEPDGAVEIRLPHRLESPNKLLHAHWRVRTRDKQAWRGRLMLAIQTSAGLASMTAHQTCPIAALGLAPVRDRRIVQVTRLVPSSRSFIRDRDNLVYSVKPLLDQIRKLRLLHDDASRWTELRDPIQAVSEDRRSDWTLVRIEIPRDPARPFGGL